MKKINLLLLVSVLFFVHPTSAADIHWTLSQSPIILDSNFVLQASDRLIIDPGVEVLFDGYYNIRLEGTIVALGTQSQPITFDVVDTTGFHNRFSQAGGWKGITSYDPYMVKRDSFQFCQFRHLKLLGASDELALAGAVFFDHCTITNCSSPESINIGNALLCVTSGDTANPITITNCQFYDNDIVSSIAMCFGSRILCSNNEIKNNRLGYGFYLFGNSTDNVAEHFNITHNLFHDNVANYRGAGVHGGLAWVYHCEHLNISSNEIYNNFAYGTAAILTISSFGEIEKNLIVNNVAAMYPGQVACVGISGAIVQMSVQESDQREEGNKIISFRNNILSNNRTETFSTIVLSNINAQLSNNTIVNNVSQSYGPSLFFFGSGKTYSVKNNIIYNNKIMGAMYGFPEFMLADNNNYLIDYNYLDKYVNESYVPFLGSTLNFSMGDTSHNIVGVNPGLTNIPNDTGASTSALGADFSLLATSDCIDAGTQNGILVGAVDFIGNARIFNDVVDIGAIEFGSKPNSIISTAIRSLPVTIYPNPCFDDLTVRFAKEREGKLEIVSSLGQIVKTIELKTPQKQKTIDVADLPKGNYILIFRNKDDKTRSAIKFSRL